MSGVEQVALSYVGDLPENWQIVSASSVCKKITDGTHDTPTVQATGVPFITAIHIKDGAIDFSTCQFVDQETHRAIFARCNPQKGDLAVVNIGAGVGECGFVDVEFEFSLKNVALLKPDPAKLDGEFLLHLHQSRRARIAHIVKAGGAQPFLSLAELRRLPIILPPLLEQKRIAQLLGTWDQAIGTIEALVANARAQKQALMQKLLTGKKRLPSFTDPWVERSLDSIFHFKKGQGLSKDAVKANGLLPCILYGELYTRYPEVIREVIGRTDLEDGVPSKSGDVLIPASTTTTGIDLANATALLEDNVLLSGDINILRPKNPKQSAPFFAYLLTHVMKHKIASRAQGITIVHLYGAHLKPLVVRVPTIDEQHAIARIIMDADDEILGLQSQLAALRQEKAALMQQLLTGKRRVKLNQEEAA